jgi:sialic acid synthase SpsE
LVKLSFRSFTISCILTSIKLLKEKPKVGEEIEKEIRKKVRRSIVAKEKILKGTVITEKMLDFKRPGTGIEPKHLDKIIGKKAKKNIGPDELIAFKDLE